MFAVLTIKNQMDRSRCTLPQRIRYQLLRPRAWGKPIYFFGGGFVLIEAEQTRRGLNWDEIQALSGRLCGNLLCPPDLSPPLDSGIIPMKKGEFHRKLMLSGVIAAASLSSLPYSRRRIALYDPRGCRFQEVEQIAKCFFETRVITPCPEEYDGLADYLLEEYGVSIVVGNDWRLAEKCMAVVLLSDRCNDLESVPLLKRVPVIASQRNDFLGCFGDFTLVLPSGWKELCPRDILPEDFAAALWEQGAKKDLLGIPPVGAHQYDHFISLKTLSNEMARTIANI